MTGDARHWTFLTNHAHALVCIARDPTVRIQDIADSVGVTLRAAQGIVSELVQAGYVTRTRVGRRNRYELDPTMPLRHPLESDQRVGALLDAVGARPSRRARASA